MGSPYLQFVFCVLMLMFLGAGIYTNRRVAHSDEPFSKGDRWLSRFRLIWAYLALPFLVIALLASAFTSIRQLFFR